MSGQRREGRVLLEKRAGRGGARLLQRVPQVAERGGRWPIGKGGLEELHGNYEPGRDREAGAPEGMQRRAFTAQMGRSCGVRR